MPRTPPPPPPKRDSNNTRIHAAVEGRYDRQSPNRNQELGQCFTEDDKDTKGYVRTGLWARYGDLAGSQQGFVERVNVGNFLPGCVDLVEL